MNELQGQTSPPYTGPQIAYAIVRNAAGQPFNLNTAAFEAYTDANVTAYAVAMTQQGSSGYWVADAPAAITAQATYTYGVYLPAGDTPADGDQIMGVGSFNWPVNYQPPSPTGTGGQEITVKSPSTLPLYAVIQNPAGRHYNAATESFEAYAAIDWTDYAIALTPAYIGSDNYFTADFPVAITTPGIYAFKVFTQASASPAVSDPSIVNGGINWAGAPQGLAGGFVGLDQAKAYLGISNSNSDAQLASLIVQASQAIDNAVKRRLELTAYQETYDGGGYSFLRLNNYPIASVASVIDTCSGRVYPGSLLVWNTEGTVRFNYNATGMGGFPCGANRFIVAYQAGYRPLPQDLQLACLQFTQFLYRFAMKDPLINSKKVGDIAISYGRALAGDFSDGLFAPIAAILQRYTQIPAL